MKYVLFAVCIIAACLEVSALASSFSPTRTIETQCVPGRDSGGIAPQAGVRIVERKTVASIRVPYSGLTAALLLTGERGNPLSQTFLITFWALLGLVLLRIEDGPTGRSGRVFTATVVSLLVALGGQFYGDIYTQNWFISHGLSASFRPQHPEMLNVFTYVVAILFGKLLITAYKARAKEV
jgi:hypothetical protein